MRRHVIATVVAAAAVLVAAVPAQAAGTAGTTTHAVAVTITPEVQAYLDTLTPRQRAEFVATKLPATIVETTGPQHPVDAAARAAAAAATLTGARVSPLATGCWTARTSGSAKAALGNTLYTYFHVGGWCASGSIVTSAWVADAGGETSTPGWSYVGVINRNSGVVSNEGRSYSQTKFVLGSGGWIIQSPTPCLRISGTSAPAATAAGTCGIS